MIYEYEDPWGAHQGVLKVQKWQKMVCERAIPGPCLTILGHSEPLDKAPPGSSFFSIILYYSPHIRSV